MSVYESRARKVVRRTFALLVVVLLLVMLVTGVYHVYKPLPLGLNFEGPARPVENVRFLADLAYVDDQGERQLEQEIFDEAFALIEGARHFVLVDMFLFNSFQGEVPERRRALSGELTDRLIRQKQRYPDMQILVISDPLNTIYGGSRAEHLQRLEAAGITVTLTDLTRLRDSNPLYSSFWRVFVAPWGNSPGGRLPSPFGDGRVSLRSYLALLNFKANHRKLLIADHQDSHAALVTSANAHDGSSAHGNVALRFEGPAVADLLESEQAVLNFSGGPPAAAEVPNRQTLTQDQSDAMALQVLTERAVERALLEAIATAQAGDRLDVAVFYLSDRQIIKALLKAQARGASIRVLLDPNKDAFGRTKDGVPNRPVAHELVQGGVELRWCATSGEQCHAKVLLARYADGGARLILGSSNFTSRNLHNLNLETSVLLKGPENAEPLRDAADWFEQQWGNGPGRRFSVDYETYADPGWWSRMKYRLMETTGLSTF